MGQAYAAGHRLPSVSGMLRVSLEADRGELLLGAAASSVGADQVAGCARPVRDNAGQLDKFPLPMDAEPATTFKP